MVISNCLISHLIMNFYNFSSTYCNALNHVQNQIIYVESKKKEKIQTCFIYLICASSVDPIHSNPLIHFKFSYVKFYISIGYLNKRDMHISSNEVPSQNQLVIGGAAHKLHIHIGALEFYQCETNPTFMFQQGL